MGNLEQSTILIQILTHLQREETTRQIQVYMVRKDLII
jgi:hypothetical protein